MKAYSLLLFYVCLNLAAALVITFDIVSIGNWGQHSDAEMSGWFNLNIFGMVAVGGGVTVAGIVAYFTKSYGLTVGLLLVWIVGVVYDPIRNLLLGFPLLLTALLPAEIAFLGTVFTVLSSVVFFMFFVEILSGRQVT